MKKIILPLFLLLTINSLFGQTDTTVVAPTTELEDDDPSRDRIIMNVHWDERSRFSFLLRYPFR